MENASKALIIAAGVLIGIMIVATIAYVFSQGGMYFRSESTEASAQKLKEFNAQYEAYNRSNLYGTDVITLVNKVTNDNKNSLEEEQIDIILTSKGNEYSKLFPKNSVYDASEILEKITEQIRIETEPEELEAKLEYKEFKTFKTRKMHKATIGYDNDTGRVNLVTIEIY